ncbi:hypothetical protein C7H19_18530 [Aphanothece hegewaldii CCALA 016]|uniref:Phage holin family protein n=1 Tax=Aphanothece hegewaldii CCALA 016 TaxID=2107694 RepID=A0A2T1LTX8_9CHRO|nr:phage holin family protein [Aphanothece hegewaldii]PSF34563.1 hypothetical protein C7H19_18530 [Aphanothece hegewaldii CCALA 016]
MDILSLLISLVVTAISFIIISKLPIGVEIDNFKKALISALVFGLLNAFVRPIISFFAFPFTLITFGLFAFVINAIIFGLAAALVQGFRLRNGIISALLGAIALAFVNSILNQILVSVLGAPVRVR